MADPRLMSITSVKVADIVVGDRLRPVRPAAVESIKQSINDLGVLKDPIHLRQMKDSSLRLIAGAHRLAAVIDLAWEDVDVKVWADVTNDWAQLMEVDDNLAGAEMNALETAVFLAERKRIYEKLHPEAVAKTGAALAAHRWNAADTMSVASFAAVTAEKFDMSERHVRRLLKAGMELSGSERAAMMSQGRVTLKDMMTLSKIGDPVLRRRAIVDYQARNCPLKDALKGVSNKAPAKPATGTDAELKALLRAWAQAGEAARRRFVQENRDEIADIAIHLTAREAA